MQLTILTAFIGLFEVLHSQTIADLTEMLPPRILRPHRSRIRAVPGEQLVIECKGDQGVPDEFSFVYWLINSTFPGVACTDGRVSETKESTSEHGRVIHRSLLFKTVTVEDFRSTFTCVISSPAGLDRKTVQLRPNHKARISSIPHVLCPHSPLIINSNAHRTLRGELKEKKQDKVSQKPQLRNKM
ncbi:hypothetical protein UPYG_G00120540 [Umbra pygmaea]|uniref:Ig-like domain-containing protein n=1 Tax=Umbra pygmaea TaxID=75934 RepID=A0ABD0X4W7_UMBPY